MEDDLRAYRLDELSESLVANIELVQRRRRSDVLACPGAEVVHDMDLLAAREQRVDEVRPDETSSARHDRPHRPRIVGRALLLPA